MIAFFLVISNVQSGHDSVSLGLRENHYEVVRILPSDALLVDVRSHDLELEPHLLKDVLPRHRRRPQYQLEGLPGGGA